MKANRGFTLIELLVVISIIAILVVIAIVAINPVRVIQDSQDTRRRADLNQIKTALQLYFNDERRYPSDLSTSSTPVAFLPTYMRELPTWWTDFGEYGVPAAGDDYDAGVDLFNPSDEDDASVTRCTSDTTNYASGDFMVCPD